MAKRNLPQKEKPAQTIPACEQCHSAEHVKPTFIGPWDEPEHHNYGDVIYADQQIHQWWCTACARGVGAATTIGGKR